MVKTLEQHITDTYLESPWAKVSHISDIDESDIEMQPPQGKEAQDDWVFEEAKESGPIGQEDLEEDPSFVPPSPAADVLDWGSDEEDVECVCPSSLLCFVHNLKESHQPLRR